MNGCENMAKKKMTEKEKQDWDALYEYVRKEVMGYDSNQSLPSTMVLRLKGLLSGKFIENNHTEDKANYSYETILCTFKYCSPQIFKALRTNSWMSEMHKFNYVLKIVESNINDVYLRMKNVQKAKEESKSMVIDTANHNGAEYQRKTKETTNKLLDDLW